MENVSTGNKIMLVPVYAFDTITIWRMEYQATVSIRFSSLLNIFLVEHHEIIR